MANNRIVKRVVSDFIDIDFVKIFQIKIPRVRIESEFFSGENSFKKIRTNKILRVHYTVKVVLISVNKE